MSSFSFSVRHSFTLPLLSLEAVPPEEGGGEGGGKTGGPGVSCAEAEPEASVIVSVAVTAEAAEAAVRLAWWAAALSRSCSFFLSGSSMISVTTGQHG